MSFINKAKNEIAGSALGDKCCQIAELSAMINAIGKISIQNNAYFLTLETEIQALPARIEKICFNVFGFKPVIEKFQDSTFVPIQKYKLSFNDEQSKQILIACYIIRQRTMTTYDFVIGISRFVVEKECCIRAYIRGIFLACASANIKIQEIDNVDKHRGGYHLEFVFSKQALAQDFVRLATSLEIQLKIIERRKNFVCYLKEMETISDLLAIVGANNAVLSLQNELAIRNVRNNLNRQLNCMNANISKTVDASMKQIQAIQLINSTIGLESLPDNLMDLCLLRLANPEETFEELRMLAVPQLTKSCINHRFRKIMEIATKIEQENQEEDK